MVSKTGWISAGDWLMTRKISLSAARCSSASVSWRRSSWSSNSDAFVTALALEERRFGSGFIPAPSFALCPLQPVRHPHLAVQRRHGGELLLRLLAFAGALVEFAEAEVAVGDEGAHAASFGKGQRLAIVSVAPLGIETVAMGRNIAE